MPSFIILLHFLGKISISFLWFFLILKISIDSALSALYHVLFLIAQQILFVELHLDQHLILFVCVNQQLLIYNDFWYNHKLINIQYYNLHLVLLLILWFLQVDLYRNQLLDYKTFFHWWWRYNSKLSLLVNNIFEF